MCPDKFHFVLDYLITWFYSHAAIAAKSLDRVLTKFALTDLSVAFECTVRLDASIVTISRHPLSLLDVIKVTVAVKAHSCAP